MIRYTIIDRPGEHDHVAGWRGRCTYCGHRVAHKFVAGGWGKHCIECRGREHGYLPVETRRRPWRIPAEIVGRFRAMRHAGETEQQPGLLFGASVIDMTQTVAARLDAAGKYQAPPAGPALTLQEVLDDAWNVDGRLGECRAILGDVEAALFAYEASVETYGDRLTYPADYADPHIATDDTLATIPAIDEDIA